MTFKYDIIKRINADFGDDANKAMKTLVDAINKVDYLGTDRIVRCIIFLSKGSMKDLEKYIESAIFDTRDVMLWAEYENVDGQFNFKRLRDFNKTFEESSIDVKE